MLMLVMKYMTDEVIVENVVKNTTFSGLFILI